MHFVAITKSQLLLVYSTFKTKYYAARKSFRFPYMTVSSFIVSLFHGHPFKISNLVIFHIKYFPGKIHVFVTKISVGWVGDAGVRILIWTCSIGRGNSNVYLQGADDKLGQTLLNHLK
jgi:hypothetical protein